MQSFRELECIAAAEQVYKARRKFTGRTVAIKIINKVGKPQKEIDSLRQELLILKTLKHPNIVEMLESIETEKEFCVVMEYALGKFSALDPALTFKPAA